MPRPVEILAIVALGMISVFAAVITGQTTIWSENFAADFGHIAVKALVAAGMFLSSIAFLPRLVGCRPIGAALIGATLVIAIALFTQFWLEDVIRILS